MGPKVETAAEKWGEGPTGKGKKGIRKDGCRQGGLLVKMQKRAAQLRRAPEKN